VDKAEAVLKARLLDRSLRNEIHMESEDCGQGQHEVDTVCSVSFILRRHLSDRMICSKQFAA
jgi:hypothetical protein